MMAGMLLKEVAQQQRHGLTYSRRRLSGDTLEYPELPANPRYSQNAALSCVVWLYRFLRG